MEIYELKYFLGVAQDQNIHRASERLRVSPGSLSKAVSRLEEELATRLFVRDGRNIKLTDQGKLLQRRASDIVRLEEAARVEVGGHEGTLQVSIAGAEILLSKMGLSLSSTIKNKFPGATFEYRVTDDESTIEGVLRGESHLGIITSEASKNSGLTSKILGEAKFQIFVGEGHPLYSIAKAKKSAPVSEVLRHAFVGPSNPLLGQMGIKQSLDGWRDDEFPRKVEYRTSSLKILEEFVTTGKAIAYLPDYFCKNSALAMLKVTGCPYSCVQKVSLIAKNPKEVGWLNQIF